MPLNDEFSNTLLVKVDGAPLPADIALQLVSGLVEESTRIPDHFVLRFTDPGSTVLDKGHFKIGARIELSLQNTAPGGPEALLVDGEVTAMEVELAEGGLFTIVRGLDRAHRLYRGTRVAAYQNMSASDIAKKIGQQVGLACRVDSTSPIFEHVTQPGESDWSFLSRLAAESGRLLTVHAGKLLFIRPPTVGEAPGGTDSRSQPQVLEQGVNLVELRATITASGQVEKVEVRGWGPKEKKPVVAKASCSTESAQPDGGQSAQRVTRALGLPSDRMRVHTDPALSDTGRADVMAKSLADHVAGGFAEVDGIARGNPALRAGTAVKLAGVGDSFSGRYVLTSTRHEFRPEVGYRTHFTASNTSDRSLFGSIDEAPREPSRLSGVVPALVTNINDDEGQGRVKVKVPWLADDYESDWCRTVHAGAGDKCGLVLMPEVGDEVLVSFPQGSFGAPYVLGGLFNGKDFPVDDWPHHFEGGKVKSRAWVSRTGMRVEFTEGPGDERVTISTNKGDQKVELLQTKKGIMIVSEGPVEVTAKQDVKVDAQQNVAIKAMQNVKVEGMKVEVSAQTALKLTGMTVDVDATTALTLKGAIVKIN